MLAGAAYRDRSRYERRARALGFHLPAGVDEVGRGALFGPVVAAAVILSPEAPIRGLRDSKQLEPERREVLAFRIRERALAWAVGAADVTEIEQLNIYHASILAMRRAIEQLRPAPDYLLIDAVRVGLPIPQEPIIHGDDLCFSIAAASIVAKVHRDAMMREFDVIYPGYGLASHKGYTTPEHVAALARLGPTPLHRTAFAPVRLSRQGFLFPDEEANAANA